MSGNIAKVPGEVTKVAAVTAMSTAALGGRLAVRLGEGVVQQAQRVQPDYVPPEILEQQAVLRNFENRFGVVGHLLERDGTERQLQDRVASTAYAMVEGGLVDEHTAVEIRPVLPVDALRDPVLNARREAAVDLLRFTLAHEHDVTAIPNSHPIMPSEHEDSPTDKARTWSVITAELDGFSHQIDETFEDHLAVLAITGPAYVRRVFGSQTAGHDRSPDRLLILKHVGLAPQDNWLVGLPLPRELRRGETA